MREYVFFSLMALHLQAADIGNISELKGEALQKAKKFLADGGKLEAIKSKYKIHFPNDGRIQWNIEQNTLNENILNAIKKIIIEDKIVSDSCEALIGAIYLDKNLLVDIELK